MILAVLVLNLPGRWLAGMRTVSQCCVLVLNLPGRWLAGRRTVSQCCVLVLNLPGRWLAGRRTVSQCCGSSAWVTAWHSLPGWRAALAPAGSPSASAQHWRPSGWCQPLLPPWQKWLEAAGWRIAGGIAVVQMCCVPWRWELSVNPVKNHIAVGFLWNHYTF